MKRSRIIHDAVHGTIRLDDLMVDLIDSPEMQKLRGIKQLGLGFLVFPGANHTRLEHCLGAAHIAGRMAEALGLDQEETKLVKAGTLLHDIGHGPFSHTLESYVEAQSGFGHEQFTARIIRGEHDPVAVDREALDYPLLTEILGNHGLDPGELADIITREPYENGRMKLVSDGGQAHFNPEREYLHQIISGPLDADATDYLLRDGHYTGVAHGTVDLERLLATIELHHNDLVIRHQGVSALEGILVARSLMYSSVYYHKVVRVTEMMLTRAVETSGLEVQSVLGMQDADLMRALREDGTYQQEIERRLRYRQLFKRAYYLPMAKMDKSHRKRLGELYEWKARRQLESDLAQRAGLPDGHVLVDMPSPAMLDREPHLAKTNVKIRSDRVRTLRDVSAVARALQVRPITDWAVQVICPSAAIAEIASLAPRLLFESS